MLEDMGGAAFAVICSFCVFTAIIITDASSCNDPCQTLNDCAGLLTCMNGKCNDDPQIGTHTCGNSIRLSNCNSNGPNSPPFIPSGTAAILTLNNFGPGGGSGCPSKCDAQYHPLPQRVVALSTGWYSGGTRCGKKIQITAGNGKSAAATVVDECDSVHGCDKEHAFQPPCKINIVAASETVWNDLDLDTEKGEVAITWSMA